ncbi:MAG: hypothetical protein L6R48_19265 [Planctomycetes bacterium]|nr:hypothetical protein [Planctomycetota bacterium]
MDDAGQAPVEEHAVKRARWRGVVAAVLLAGLAGAAEEPLCDWRLVAGTRPTAFSYTWQNGATSRSGDDAFRRATMVGSGLRWGLGAAGSPHKLALGLAIERHAEELDGGSAVIWAGRLECGWAYAPAPRWQTYLGVGAAGGLGTLELPGAATGDARLRGRQLEAGAEAELRWRPWASWGVGLGAGWLLGRDRYQGDGVLELRRSGPAVSLSLAWIIDPLPARID